MPYTAEEMVCNCHPDTEGFHKGLHKYWCQSYRAGYPELIGYQHRGEKVPPPEFPKTCPACGAPQTRVGYTDYTGKFTPGMSRHASAEYACGGSYDMKPQIQNHTDYWWGVCGLREKQGK